MNDAKLPFFVGRQRAFGMSLPARMTVLPLPDGELALVSPIAIDDATAAAIAELGQVRYLIAPNLLHHLHLGAALARYPDARLLAPPGLAQKRPDLPALESLADGLPGALAEEVELVRFGGAPSVDEFVFFHRASRTLVVTDLVLHVTHPNDWLTGLVLGLAGCRGKLAHSLEWRLLVRDRGAARASVARLLELPFETLLMAHGEPIEEQASARLAGALGRLARGARLV